MHTLLLCSTGSSMMYGFSFPAGYLLSKTVDSNPPFLRYLIKILNSFNILSRFNGWIRPSWFSLKRVVLFMFRCFSFPPNWKKFFSILRGSGKPHNRKKKCKQNSDAMRQISLVLSSPCFLTSSVVFLALGGIFFTDPYAVRHTWYSLLLTASLPWQKPLDKGVLAVWELLTLCSPPPLHRTVVYKPHHVCAQ